jgi:hypothetical protein
MTLFKVRWISFDQSIDTRLIVVYFFGQVCTFIDGVNSVKRIAELAEVDLNLARACIQHLLFVLLFQASRTPHIISSAFCFR